MAQEKFPQQSKNPDEDLVKSEGVPGGAVTADYEVHHADGYEHHVVPLKTYYTIFGMLMVLLMITVAAADFDGAKYGLPWLNIIIALVIAVAKAVLIVLYFMHVKYSSNLVKIFAVTAYFFLIIMFGITYADYFTRHMLPVAGQ